MTSLAADMEAVAAEIELVLDGLLPIAEGDAAKLAEAMRYSTLSAGKRFRPYLVVATGTILDAPKAPLLRAGAAVELIHCYSLIHDDLPAMDDGQLRRGRPTCHLAFDDATAILAGDALQALAFDVLARSDYDLHDAVKAKLVAKLAMAAGFGGMCSGQMLDLEAERKELNLEQTRKLQAMKTGAIIRFAAEAAASIANAGEEHEAALTHYADHLGLAFQIRDDLLDFLGNSTVTGKDSGRDQSVGKATFVSHLGVDGANDWLERLRSQATNELQIFGGRAERLRELFDFVIYRDR